MNPVVLEAQGLAKAYGAVQALRDVSLSIGKGEIVALCGDNGAGKSTLVKILSGAIQPDRGEIFIGGKSVNLQSPRDARAHRIAIVYQDLALVDSRDVGHNMFLGNLPTRRLQVDRRRMYAESRRVLEELRINVPSVRTPVSLLSGGQRQGIAIARAVADGGMLMIMDEPTAALGVQEQEKVLNLVRKLQSDGIAVLIVSHNLEQVFSLSDRVVVLRAGRLAGSVNTGSVTPSDVVGLITGATAQTVASTEQRPKA